MHISRKLVYTVILAYYYTFVVIFSINIGYTDVIASTLAITLISYFWIIRSVAKAGAYALMDYRDLAVNVFVYSFVSFYIAGMALVFSGRPITFLHAFLTITPITVWTFIWADYYLQKMKGKM